MKSASLLVIIGCLLVSTGHAEEFVCPDDKSKEFDDKRWKIKHKPGNRKSVDKAIDKLVNLAGEANRPEDRFALQRICNKIGYVLLDEGLVEEKASSLDGCPENTVEEILRGREERKRFYGEDPYLPIVRVGAVYPAKALEQELSGEVVVEFTVTKKGDVKKVQIVESTNEIFNKSALASAKRLRYKPKQENGKAVETTGVKDRIVFDYEKKLLDDELWDCPR